MKKAVRSLSLICMVVLLMLSILSTSVFAIGIDITNQKNGLTNWLKNQENTGFDFSDTSYNDNDIDWAIFTLSRCGVKSYPEYENYINEAVEKNFASLFPSDLARISLATSAYGLDAENIGGHNLIEELKGYDYTTQIYLSSLSYPLMALNFKDYGVSKAITDSIVATIINAQQTDGGFPYCTVDSGWGVSSEPDITAMVLQSLAPYKDEANVSSVIEKGLDYLKTQQFDNGAFGYKDYNSQSGETTAQVIVALCRLGIDPQGDEYSKGTNNAITALEAFLDASGAAVDYSSTVNTMSSYQVLLGYNSYERFINNENSVYSYDNTFEIETTIVTVSETTTAKFTSTSASETKIPKTGANSPESLVATVVVLSSIGIVALSKKTKL